MPELSPQYLLVFVAFVLPGAISMYFYSLMVPQEVRVLKDRILEAVCFSIANFLMVFPAIYYMITPGFLQENVLVVWLMVVVFLMIMPAIWPFVFVRLLRILESRNLITVQSKTAWDEFFSRARSGCWLIVELNDGSHIGGRFGDRSYASAFPDPGHLYIEELWEIDSNKIFRQVLPGKPGAILRPSDYHHVEVFKED